MLKSSGDDRKSETVASSDASDPGQRSLLAAIRTVRNRSADYEDVRTNLRDTQRNRLEILADDLLPVVNEIDEADERFDFGISQGETPRLWIDMTSFVAMGRNGRNYRFLKDTRAGRVVLGDTEEAEEAAEIVTEYIAEKVLERERALEGEWLPLRQRSASTSKIEQAKEEQAKEEKDDEDSPVPTMMPAHMANKPMTEPSTKAASVPQKNVDVATSSEAKTKVGKVAETAKPVKVEKPAAKKKGTLTGFLWLMFLALALIVGIAVAVLAWAPEAF